MAFTQDGTFRFMDLPQELKDMIYHELWQQGRNVLLPQVQVAGSRFHPNNINYSGVDQLRYGLQGGCGGIKHLGDEVYGLPLWLLTNKDILRQGLQHFRSNASLTPAYDMDDSLEYSIASLIPLVDIDQATKLRICIDVGHVYNGDSWHHRDSSWEANKTIERILRQIGSKLSVLTLIMCGNIWGASPIVPEKPWKFNLTHQSMENLKLHKLELRLELHDRPDLNEYLAGCSLRSGFENEVIRLGARLVGDGERLETRAEPATLAKVHPYRHLDTILPLTITTSYTKDQVGGV
ncbi:hypothetical protein EK21DRAFT_110690 [Setomelanomma holmii]|uniref:Uncharacterized protein n=1 Tax=Setomelanomma holmii TaxID=210430 RepID=A0A9P4LP23_9PLEO|nr:hypothetical protein EK21DRAFT_110690 [Setomelanomma holmii]